ncbi:hypothetical protein [Streptomyces anulatus]|uniref:hypothetical protein n=1 Tax=Streptomyces anulatus TaxID=1892 RepID=UPI0012FE943B|nr:hypothetical protein [Streptomyces anulatus]
MATYKALAGALRWARGAVIVLCAALAVLVHHETAAIAVTSVPSATHAGHAMHGCARCESVRAQLSVRRLRRPGHAALRDRERRGGQGSCTVAGI